jgi:hypothetical protein
MPDALEYRFVDLTPALYECSGCGGFHRMKRYARLAPVSDSPRELFECSSCGHEHGKLGPVSPASAHLDS